MTSLDLQHDGRHYKDQAIQPIEFLQANHFSACESFAIKHIARHRLKGESVTDLKKAIHYLQMLMEFEHGIEVTVHYNHKHPGIEEEVQS